jgi:hypothetical protein
MVHSHERHKQSAVDRVVDAFETLVHAFGRMPDAREVGVHLGIKAETARIHLADARQQHRIPKFVMTPRKAPTRIAVTQLEQYIDLRLRPTIEMIRTVLRESKLPPKHASRKHLLTVVADLREELHLKLKLRNRLAAQMR